MRASAAALAAVCLVAAGCGSDRASKALDLSRLVLQPRDLPSAFAQFDAGKQVTSDATGSARTDPERFGRLGGWKARYRLIGGSRTSGLQIVESRVDAFESEDGAKTDLAAYRSDWADLGAAPLSAAPALGDEAVALSRAQGSGRLRIRFFVLVWREANVTASLGATGFARGTAYRQVLALARTQAGRIEAELQR